MSIHGRCLHHEPCPQCGSSDNLARYEDGYGKCFSMGCAYWEPSNEQRAERLQKKAKNMSMLENYEIKELPKRKLTLTTCQKWNYGVAPSMGKNWQVAVYRSADGKPVAQKLRDKDKNFLILGDAHKMPLFGMNLWKAGGKRLVITEGEIDAMSVSQMFDHKWPVVSVPNGAKGALPAIRDNFEYVASFNEVVIAFDSDGPGREAAAQCAAILPPGKAFIAELPLKDANEMLKADRVQECIQCFWQARAYRPDGIVEGKDIELEDLFQVVSAGYQTQYPILNTITRGLRKREVILLTAGTGIGKSTLARELAYHLRKKHNLRIGNVYLEESYQKTAQGYIAIDNNVPLGDLRSNPNVIPREAAQKSKDELLSDGMFFYDHFGSLESESLMLKLEYLATCAKVDFIVLDHISIVVSGMETNDERKDIDVLMTKLRSLVERTGVGVIAICHLKQVEGKAHEEGGQVSLNHLRGSGTLKQIPDTIIALERNQQAADDDANVTQFRVLKNREFGTTGPAGFARYDIRTGRLLPHIPALDDEPDPTSALDEPVAASQGEKGEF